MLVGGRGLGAKKLQKNDTTQHYTPSRAIVLPHHVAVVPRGADRTATPTVHEKLQDPACLAPFALLEHGSRESGHHPKARLGVGSKGRRSQSGCSSILALSSLGVE